MIKVELNYHTLIFNLNTMDMNTLSKDLRLNLLNIYYDDAIYSPVARRFCDSHKHSYT